MSLKIGMFDFMLAHVSKKTDNTILYYINLTLMSIAYIKLLIMSLKTWALDSILSTTVSHKKMSGKETNNTQNNLMHR